MDRTTELISSYATSLSYSDLTPEAIHATKRSIIDTLGCAMAGFLAEPSKIARRVAGMVSSELPSRILGTAEYSSPDMAAFTNTVMANYVNYDDVWLDLHNSGRHPSRVILAVLALADPLGSTGREVITATVAGYDVVFRICDQVGIRELGWNQGIGVSLGSAAALGNLLGLPQEEAANALSLAAINGLTMRQTRASQMPFWKCADTADANRNVVNYALLAREGMTAPGEPFEGQWGLWHQAGASGVELEPFGDGPFKIALISMKNFPCHAHAQSPIELALQLREEVKFEEIEAINLQYYYRALHTVGGDPDKPEKWDPQTREDADHSMPWLLATAFRDGAISPASFLTERVRDPELRPVMRKVTMTENPEFSRQYPAAHHCDLEVVSRSGERHRATSIYPKGHRLNPLTDQELEAKFIGLAEEVLTPGQCSEALRLLWRLEELDDISPIFDALQV